MKLENYGCEYVNSQIFWENFFPGRTVGEEVVEAGFVKSIKELIEKIAKQDSKIKEDPRVKSFASGNAMAIPAEGKTSIQKIQDEDGNIIESRKFNGSLSGASFAIAQVVGYFALARQMNQKISLKDFIAKTKELQHTNSKGKLYTNPREVIEKMYDEREASKFRENDPKVSIEDVVRNAIIQGIATEDTTRARNIERTNDKNVREVSKDD